MVRGSYVMKRSRVPLSLLGIAYAKVANAVALALMRAGCRMGWAGIEPIYVAGIKVQRNAEAVMRRSREYPMIRGWEDEEA